jgi:hypothetical protein
MDKKKKKKKRSNLLNLNKAFPLLKQVLKKTMIGNFSIFFFVYFGKKKKPCGETQIPGSSTNGISIEKQIVANKAKRKKFFILSVLFYFFKEEETVCFYK